MSKCPVCRHRLPTRPLVLKGSHECTHCGARVAFRGFRVWLFASLIGLVAFTVSLTLLGAGMAGWAGATLFCAIAMALTLFLLGRPVEIPGSRR